MTNSDRSRTHATGQLPTFESQPSRPPVPLVFFGLLVLVVAAILFSAMPARGQQNRDGGTTQRGDEINRIILRVNDQILTLYDYESEKATQIARILSNPSLEPDDRQARLSQLGKQLIKASFDEMLLLSRAKQMSVIVSEDQVTAAIDQVRANQGLASQQEFEQALRMSNLSIDDLRDEYRREMTMREVVSREVQDRIDLSEDAMRSFYRENPDRFMVAEKRRLEEVIVFSASGLDEAQMQQVASEILAAARGGASLGEASLSYRDQGIVSEVVDLGWLESEEIGTELRQAAFSTEPGSYAEPIEARGGLHILRVAERQEGGLRSFSEVQAEVRQQVQARDFGRELNAYMAELEARSFIHESLPPEAVGFRSLLDAIEPEPDAIELFRAPELPAVEEESDRG